MLHTRPRPKKSRQGIPKESSVFISFVSDTSLGQRKFSKSESTYVDIGIVRFVKGCPHMRTMAASELMYKSKHKKGKKVREKIKRERKETQIQTSKTNAQANRTLYKNNCFPKILLVCTHSFLTTHDYPHSKVRRTHKGPGTRCNFRLLQPAIPGLQQSQASLQQTRSACRRFAG